MELLIDKVSKKFKDKKAVDNISLELMPGVWQDNSDADDCRNYAAHLRPGAV